MIKIPRKSVVGVSGEMMITILGYKLDCLIFDDVPVNRNPTPDILVFDIDRQKNVDERLLVTMPKGEGDVACLNLFSLKVPIDLERLVRIFYFMKMRSADPFELTALYEYNSAFGPMHSSVFWSQGCFMDLRILDGEPTLDIFKNPQRIFSPGTWFAGVLLE